MNARFDASEDHLQEKVLESMEENGYAIVERFLTPERVRAMKTEVTKALDDAETPTGRNDFEGFKTRRMYAVFKKVRCFDDLAIHPLVIGVMEHFLGDGLYSSKSPENFLLSSPTGIEIGPGEKEQLLHRDDGKYQIPLPHKPLIVNSMWALDDFTKENGATVIYPGSHKFSEDEQMEVFHHIRQDTPLPRNTHKAYAEMPAGSVMFYHGSALHGGGANQTDKTRLGVILEYCAGWLRPQENHILAVGPELMSQLPERLQQLLGYSVCSPFIGYVNGYHPRRVLNDPEQWTKGAKVKRVQHIINEDKVSKL